MLHGLELRSLVSAGGELRLHLRTMPVPPPADDEITVRIEASPVNPSDLGTLLGPVDLASLTRHGDGETAYVTGMIAPEHRGRLAGRFGEELRVGNEAAGIVVEAGGAMRAMIGKRVAMFGGAMYAEYRTINARDCLVLPPGTDPAKGAAAFVNPLTALGMVEVMRSEGHHALLHTAAASNLGQMLNRLCIRDNIPLVNVVRSAPQAALLRDAGAAFVCDSSAPDFEEILVAALAETGATLAFDAVGGGGLAGRILSSMEKALDRRAGSYSRYGSAVHKQVYIYGSLDPGPTIIDRKAGMAWGIGGWLVLPFLERIGPERAARLRERVIADLGTIFRTRYAREISLAELLTPETLRACARNGTGAKMLVNPARRPSETA
ncbi:NADH oxidase [Sphingomonas colocasiae]|uniref:NADH oxidase n=2 Tax=Sphingomonas colocasiae TaxID=1848973 RepID=A0ABS7PJR2_9SPHN|nr:NADH oxidase [Sphingomonas colocasiae]